MKKIICVLVAVLILFAVVPIAIASADVSVDKTTAQPGNTVTISGTADANASVIIKVTDEVGNIVFFDAAKTDANGKYAVSFTVSSDTAPGKLTVTAGSGTDVATATVMVTSPSTPTPQPTAEPTAKPTSTPTSTPMETSTPTPTKTAQSEEGELTPTQTPEDSQDIIVSSEVSQDEETGIIVITIDVDDLPEGTVAVETPDGEVVYVSDAEDGVIVIEVTEDEVNEAGTIEIIALDDEGAPLASYDVQVLDENKELVVAKTGETDGSAWIIIVCIVAGVIALGLAVFWILLRRRNKQAQGL